MIVVVALVLLATATVVLGPRWVVVDGQLVFGEWLAVHPTVWGITAALGGLQSAGNLVLFVPLAAAIAILVRRRWLGRALLVLVPLPLVVEVLQRAIPGRVSDAGDVLLNTTGLLLAYGGIALVRWAFGGRVPPSNARTAPLVR